MSMSLKLSKKQVRTRRNVVSLCMYSAFFLSWLLLKVSIWNALIIAIIVYVGIYGVYEILDFKKRKKLAQSGISDIDTMDGFQFEHYLVELFKKYNYKAVRTQDTSDYGADLILKKDDQKIVVQAKRHAQNVGIKAVQEVLGAKSFYKADEAWVVANSHYTKSAKELANECGVRLVDRNELVAMLMKLQNKRNQVDAKEIKATIEPKEEKVCSKCGADMVLRNSKHGVFYGCSRFPKCTNTMKAK